MTLDEFLHQNRMTEAALAEKAGVSQSYINRLRRGMNDNASASVLRKIVTATNGKVTADEMIGVASS